MANETKKANEPLIQPGQQVDEANNATTNKPLIRQDQQVDEANEAIDAIEANEADDANNEAKVDEADEASEVDKAVATDAVNKASGPANMADDLTNGAKDVSEANKPMI